MPEDAVFAADLERLGRAVQRERKAAIAVAAASVVTWTHARGATASPYRAGVFARERGVVYRKVFDGRPDDLRNVTLFGLDAKGRAAHERVYDEDGTLIWETVGSFEEDARRFITYGLDPDGGWAPENAALEVWDGDRVLWVSSMHARSPGSGVRERYLYDGDRVVAIVETRLMGHGSSVGQSWEVQYGADGKPAALISGGMVEWRRRAGSRERGRALTAAEDALTAGLGQALTDWSADLPDQILFIHQDAGDWVDQAMPIIAVPTGGEPGEDPRRWLPAEWAHVYLAGEHVRAISETLAALDATGTPVEDEPRRLLQIVARRVAVLVERRRGRSIRCLVTTHDPEDILADVGNAP
jgi:hypothetical protein